MALKRIAFLLERADEPAFRVKAFRNAASVLGALPPGELGHRVAAGTLQQLKGIGEVTAKVVAEAAAGATPAYLAQLEAAAEGSWPPEGGRGLRALLRGDCHVHSDWSDGGSPIREMAEAAMGLGHEYMVLTDHSPRLKVARGLTAERLRSQLEVVRALNAELAPFRILTGIEVDILDDGSLDQEAELLAELDVVVASVHSKLRMPSEEMTPRMVMAVANPNVDILGHCTGRYISGKQRPESAFDAEIVFPGVPAVRRGGRDQLPGGAAGPAAAAAAAGAGDGVPVRDRQRRARAGPAGLDSIWVYAGGGVRGTRGAHCEYVGDGAAGGGGRGKRNEKRGKWVGR